VLNRPGEVYVIKTKRKLIAFTIDKGIVFFKKITKVCIQGGKLISGTRSGMAMTTNQYADYTAEYIFRYRMKYNDLQGLIDRTNWLHERFISPSVSSTE
jgi:hypothetical protein